MAKDENNEKGNPAELEAMNKIFDALKSLDKEACNRIIRSVQAFFGLS